MRKGRGRIVYSDSMRKEIVQIIQGCLGDGTSWHSILKKIRTRFPNYVGSLDALKQLYNRLKLVHGKPTRMSSAIHPTPTSTSELNQTIQQFVDQQVKAQTEKRTRQVINKMKQFIAETEAELSV